MDEVSDDLRQACPGLHLAQLHDHLPNHRQELVDAFGDWLPELQKLKAAASKKTMKAAKSMKAK